MHVDYSDREHRPSVKARLGTLLGSAAGACGGTELLHVTRRVAGISRRAYVLMYHRVSPEPQYAGLAVSPERFRDQLSILRRRTRVVPLRQLVVRLSDPSPLEEHLAAVTFDDGYRDNLEMAEPILAAQGVTATVFVTTDFVDGRDVPLSDRLERAVRAMWARGIQPARLADVGDRPATEAVAKTLLHPGDLRQLRALSLALRALSPADRGLVLRKLEGLAAVPADGDRLMLSWDGVRELARRGIEIGSHGVSHPILSGLTQQEASIELRSSRERIEAEIGEGVSGFAFPYGSARDYSRQNVSDVREAGYAYACTAVRGSNAPGSDAYVLRRIGVGQDSRGLLDLKLALGGPQQRCAG